MNPTTSNPNQPVATSQPPTPFKPIWIKTGK